MTSALAESPGDIVTMRPAPRREPPFDDELSARPLRLLSSSDQPLPFQAPARVGLPTSAPPTSAPPTSGLPASHALPSPDSGRLPDPTLFSRRLVVGLLETMAGRRAVRQLSGHLSLSVATALQRRLSTRSGAARRPATLRSVHVFEPADGVAEVAAVIQDGPRVRAIALRLEGTDGRWRCVRLQTA